MDIELNRIEFIVHKFSAHMVITMYITWLWHDNNEYI